MRLQRGVPVAGVDPQVAREIVRACHDSWRSTERVADRVRLPVEVAVSMLRQLADAGFLELRDAQWSSGDEEWNTTLAGGALTMASFLKPIPRARAERLLASVIDRAEAYNADDGKPYVITEIVVFGSYVHTDVTELGDLDLAVKFTTRRPEFDDPDAMLAYAHQSGRSFSTFVEELAWPQQELLRLLRNRSGYINLHTEDITRFTDTWTVVYRYLPDVPDAG